MSEVDYFYLNKPEPNGSCLLALRRIILKIDEQITETIKYGMPCFYLAKKPLFYLWIDKKTDEPYILFVNGKYLDHPALEAGNRAKMKILRINPNEDLPVDTINMILTQAVELHKKMK